MGAEATLGAKPVPDEDSGDTDREPVAAPALTPFGLPDRTRRPAFSGYGTSPNQKKEALKNLLSIVSFVVLFNLLRSILRS